MSLAVMVTQLLSVVVVNVFATTLVDVSEVIEKRHFLMACK